MIYNNITLAQKVAKNNISKKIKELMSLNEYSQDGILYKRNKISGEWLQQ